MTARLPALFLAEGEGVPAVCGRHGEPATRRRPVSFRSFPPRWSYVLLVLGVLPFVIVAAVTRKRLRVPNWPFCARCGRVRVLRVLGGTGLMLLGFLGVIGFSVALPPESAAAGVVVVLCFLVLLTGVVIVGTTGWASVASAYLSMDGGTVHVRRPHPRFAAPTATPLV